ncbi:MAG: ferredoxin--NADP reductase [Planctomycetota bacterium]
MNSDLHWQQRRDQDYNATVIRRIDVHDDLARFHIKPDTPFPPFAPGQFVTLALGNWESRLPGTQAQTLSEKEQSRLVKRAYSISCPMLTEDESSVVAVNDVDYLEFYIVLVRENEGPDSQPPALTPRLWELSDGDRLNIGKKITGHYTLQGVDADDTVLMIGTGTGEAPHNAMSAQLLRDGHRGAIINVTTSRVHADLGYTRQHAVLQSRYPQYHYIPLTTREPENLDPSCPGFVGKQYAQDCFESGFLEQSAGIEFSPQNTHVFLCGNPAMIGITKGDQTLSRPGMLQILQDRGYDVFDHHAPDDSGTVRYEKYW